MMETTEIVGARRAPWNKGKLVGQKAPLKLKEIWAIRVRLQLADRRRELALFNLAIDSKLRACDLVKLRVRDVCHGQIAASRHPGQSSCSKRPSSRCSLKSLNPRATPSECGSQRPVFHRTRLYFRAGSKRRSIYRRGSTPESLTPGSARSD